MLALLFYIEDVMYAIKCEKVREIAPLVTLKHIPHTPDYFSGYFNFRGEIVPVIDLCTLIRNKPCRMRLSSRIILVDYKGSDNKSYILGLMAERVTETVKKAEKDFIKPSIRSDTAPYLGGIVLGQEEMIQYIDLDRLPDCIRFLPMWEGEEEEDGSIHN